MQVILEILYAFIMKKSKYKNGWKKYIIYPFVWFCYQYKVKFIVGKFIDEPNTTIPFKESIVEYASFLTVIKRTLYPDKDINDLIVYKDTSHMAVSYDNNDKVKSVLYTFTDREDSMEIKVNVNIAINLMTMAVKTKKGTCTFSFNSLIDSKLTDIKDSAEKIIREDIGANLVYILLKDQY